MSGRYSRQELFAPIGPDGQRRLRASRALIIGAGALGASNAEALARAGVGKIVIADRDYVEWSNLQRQSLYSEEDAQARMPKAVAAKRRLEQINSDVSVEALVMDVTTEEIDELAKGADCLIDATDNFDTRFLINDISQKHRIPWIYGACVGSYGITYTIVPGKTPCLNCLLAHVPMTGATCDTAGIIGPAAQMVAAYQSSEALKVLSGDFAALRGKLVSFDLWHNRYAAIQVEALKKSDCPSCGEQRSYPYLQASNHTKTAVLCGRDTVQIRPPAPVRHDLDKLAENLSRQAGTVEQNPFLVSFQTDGRRMVIFRDGRVLIHGTKDVAEARSLYHRYLG